MPKLSTWKMRMFGFSEGIDYSQLIARRRSWQFSGYVDLIRPDFGLRKAINCAASPFERSRGWEARNVASAEMSRSESFTATAGIVWLKSFCRSPDRQSR